MSIADTHRNLLIDEEPLQVLPTLAARVGLHEAIILQQIHYWLNPKRKSGKVIDGTRWIFNSYKQWTEQFPFLTERVIGNAIRELENQGLLLSRQDLNATGSDRRKWYTVDYDVLHGGQNTLRDSQRPDSDDERPTRDDDDTQTGHSSITEITTEKTAEITSLARSRFDEFWQSYPRKAGKKDAEAAFRKVNWRKEDFDGVMAALEKHKQSDQWTRDDGQFIPYPATWLRKERWADDVPQRIPGSPRRNEPFSPTAYLMEKARKEKEAYEQSRDNADHYRPERRLAGEDENPGASRVDYRSLQMGLD